MKISHVDRRGLFSMLASFPVLRLARVQDFINIKDKQIHKKRPIPNGGNYKMPNVVNARDVRNGWGVNSGGDPNQIASALAFIGTRWLRQQFDGDITSGVAAIQRALETGGYPDPNLKVQLLLNDYLQNAGVNTWNNQQAWILNGLLPLKGPNGRSVIAAIEGPNEMNTLDGAGARGPNDTINKTGGAGNQGDVINDDAVADANFVDWARSLSTFRNNNAAAMSGIEILSPTILYYNGLNFPSSLNVSNFVDYGTFHYYAGINGNNGCPSWPSNPGNFSHSYGFAQSGICPGKPLVQSEGGFSTFAGGGYGQDTRSAARYILMQIFDHFAVGGHRFMIYNLFNNGVSVPGNITNWNEDNFGLYYGDGVTPKFPAIALNNLSNLLSLNNNYADAANMSDTKAFTPAYVGNGFSVDGLQDAGTSGYYLIMPKSDGTTAIAIWNEPTIDTGSGTSATPTPNKVTVNFGSNQTYKVYDPTGGGNVADFTAKVNLTPIATGSGTSVSLTLYAIPLIIEIGSAGPVTPIKKTAESKDGTSITKTTDAALGDSQGNAWSLVASSSGNQVAINGVADATTAQVATLSYVNKKMWQQNSGKLWWSRSSPSDAWSPPAGTATAPVSAKPSADGATISSIGPVIIDNSLNSWTLVAGSNGNQVAVNGVADLTTAQVISLGIFGGVVWQQNSGKTWWSKTSPTASWSPPAGTTTAPKVTTSTSKAPDTNALQAAITTGISSLNAYGTNAAKAAVTALNAAVTAIKAVT